MLIIRICLFLFLSVFLIQSRSLAEVGDRVPSCNVSYESAKQSLLGEIQRLENSFLRYRWAEFKIRIFEYDRLWKARRASNDPLSKTLRQDGEAEEAWLLSELERLDGISRASANAVERGLKALMALNGRFSGCCVDKDVQQCFETAFKPLSRKAFEMNALFQTLFEGDRAYRKEVGLTIGGREGLYPEDTVEPEAQHAPYFVRYEFERRQARFQEDASMAEAIQDLRQILLMKFSGDLCCFGCGKTDWDRKSSQIFDLAGEGRS